MGLGLGADMVLLVVVVFGSSVCCKLLENYYAIVAVFFSCFFSIIENEWRTDHQIYFYSWMALSHEAECKEDVMTLLCRGSTTKNSTKLDQYSTSLYSIFHDY